MNKNHLIWIVALFILVLTPSVLADIPLSDFVAGWEFNEASGTVSVDVLKLTNASWSGTYVMGVSGLASTLNASINVTADSSFATLTDNARLGRIPASDKLTMNVWLKPNATPTNGNAKVLLGQWGATIGTQNLIIQINNASNIINPTLATGDGSAVTLTTITQCVLTYKADTKFMLSITWNGNNVSAYVNGVFCGSASHTRLMADSSQDTLIGKTDNNANVYRGQMDSLMLFNNSLSASQILELYNEGAGNPYPFLIGNSSISFTGQTPADNTAQYFYSNNNLTINTTVVDVGGTINSTHYVYNSTNALLYSYSENVQNLTHTFTNLPVGGYFFNATFSNGTATNGTTTRTFYIYNFTSGVLDRPLNYAHVNQSLFTNWSSGVITPSGTSVIISNYSVYLLNNDSSLNRTLSVTTALNFTQDLYALNLSVGDYKVKIGTKDSNSNEQNSSTNTFSLRNNALLNISLVNYTSGSIASFSLNVTNLNTSVMLNYSTSSSVVSLDVIKGYHYALLFDAANYAYNTTTYVVNNSPFQSYQGRVWPSNSLNLTIYDALTSAKIAQPISITVTLTVANNYSTSIGNILISNLEEGLVEVKASNVNYSEGRIYITVTNRSTQSASIYLTGIGTSSNVTLNWYDINGAPISGLFVTESVVTANGSVLAGSYYSDIDGASYFTYNSLYYYIFNCTSTTYQCNGFILNPPRKPSYDITLGYIAAAISYSSLNVSGSASFNNVSKILTFNYSSGDSSTLNYSYSVSQVSNGVNTLRCSGSSAATSNSFACDLTGRTGLVYVQGVADGQVFFGSYVDIGGGSKLFGQMDAQDSAYLTGFLMLIIVFFGLVLGVLGTLISGVIALFIMFLLGVGDIISVSLIVVDIVVVIIIALGLKRR